MAPYYFVNDEIHTVLQTETVYLQYIVTDGLEHLVEKRTRKIRKRCNGERSINIIIER